MQQRRIDLVPVPRRIHDDHRSHRETAKDVYGDQPARIRGLGHGVAASIIVPCHGQPECWPAWRWLACRWPLVIVARQTPTPVAKPSPAASNVTAVPGITVGHFTLTERPTGCTVILAANGATGAVDVRGGAPGTVETDLLSPENTVERVNAVFLSGGSAHGLAVRTGIDKFLFEKKVGYPTGSGPVPIVPGAILYDLGIGNRPDVWPDADCGYKAAAAAKAGTIEEGSVGAGAGATVGKMMGGGRAMKGGIGSAALVTSDGLIVGAIVAVNAVGSVIDPRTAKPIAGVRTADGRGLEDPFALVRRGVLQSGPARARTPPSVSWSRTRGSRKRRRRKW